MVAEGNLKSKSLYKAFLLLLKFLPLIMALCNVANTVLAYFCIDLVILTYICSVGFLPLIFMYLAAFVFGFCLYHRIFLDYTTTSTCITIYDYYVGIPVTDAGIMTLQLVLFFVACVVALIAHLKHKKHDTNIIK